MNKKIKMSKEYTNSLTNKQLSQMVMVTNDGQGDTSITQVDHIKEDFIQDEISFDSNIELIDMLWEDTNYNMTRFLWIENNTFYEIQFTK